MTSVLYKSHHPSQAHYKVPTDGILKSEDGGIYGQQRDSEKGRILLLKQNSLPCISESQMFTPLTRTQSYLRKPWKTYWRAMWILYCLMHHYQLSAKLQLWNLYYWQWRTREIEPGWSFRPHGDGLLHQWLKKELILCVLQRASDQKVSARICAMIPFYRVIFRAYLHFQTFPVLLLPMDPISKLKLQIHVLLQLERTAKTHFNFGDVWSVHHSWYIPLT